MGFLDSFSSTQTDKGWQVLLPDDDTFWFRKLDIADLFLVERDKQKAVVSGWPDLNSNKFPCPGYKQAHIPQCRVTLCTRRDIIFEVIPGIVPSQQRPDGGRALNRKTDRFSFVSEIDRLRDVVAWCAHYGNQRLMRVAGKKSKQPAMDKIIMWLGIGFVIELFILLALIGLKGGISL